MIRAACRIRALLLMALVVIPTAGHACGVTPAHPSMLVQRGQSYDLAVRSNPAPLRAGEPFTLHVTVCPRPGATAAATITADATMPDHRHGMNYRPRITREGANLFRADGFLLHMPGRWQFAIEIRSGAVRELITWDITLP